MLVAFCFALGAGIELYSLKWISGFISFLNTLNLTMFTLLVGAVVCSSWGKVNFEKLQWHLKSRTLPGDEALNGGVMSLAGFCLMTPGFVTDLAGFLILFPLTRGIFKKLTLSLVKKKIAGGEVYFFFRD